MSVQKKPDNQTVVYRSGTAARLAGLPVETLRIWERRYALSDARRSERGQRLYSAQQVARLGLLKQLVDEGHAIGVLAALTHEQLQAMLGVAGEGPAEAIPVVLAGPSLARRVMAEPRTHELDVRGHCPRIDQAAALEAGGARVLVAELPELDERALPLLAAARDALGVAATVVLYRFSASATIRALRAQGCLVARVPADLSELAPLCRSALNGRRPAPPELPGAPLAPPRFDDEALATLSAAGNRIACECPRHLSELLMMVGSFERYSAACANRNPDDARLHARLERAAGQARVVLEEAMAALAAAEGLPLPPARA